LPIHLQPEMPDFGRLPLRRQIGRSILGFRRGADRRRHSLSLDHSKISLLALLVGNTPAAEDRAFFWVAPRARLTRAVRAFGANRILHRHVDGCVSPGSALVFRTTLALR
jgi:hypothetical protein